MAGGGANLNVGDLRTIRVSAIVTGGAANDGVFTFDHKLLATNLLNPGDPPAVQVVGLATLVDTEPTLGGSTGTPAGAGLAAVAGGYDETNRGVGAEQLLFETQVQAVAPGVVNFVAGPDTVPYGFHILLWQSSDAVTVVYAAGPTLSVVVPEPSVALGMTVVGIAAVGQARGRGRSGNVSVK